MNIQTVMIDKQTAEKYLQSNTKNRRLKPQHVAKLTREITGGRWSLNGDTIKFSSDGTLIDGQHRLHAIRNSGVTVPALVVFGVDDPNAFKTIDTNGLSRGVATLADTYYNIPNANNVSAIARRLLHWDSATNKDMFTFSTEAWRQISKAEILEYLEANNHEIQRVFGYVAKSLPCRRCGSGSALVTALILCGRADEVTNMMFIDGLITGRNLTENSPVALLRDRLIAPPDRRGIWWELEIMALTIKSFNKFMYHKPLKTLRWLPQEKFPTPGEC